MATIIRAEWEEMLKRRSWTVITVDILEAVLTPSNKMKIMYQCNLNFSRFNKYFSDLLRKGFIEEVNTLDNRRLYKITDRGRTLLEVLKKAHEIASSEND